MPLWGIDISHYQAGLDLGRVKAEGFDYVIAKVSEGDGYRDASWPGFRDAARAHDLLLVGYHYVRSGPSAAAQADCLLSHLGDHSVPVMLDHEAGSGGTDMFRAVRDAIQTRGPRVVISYLPKWYWQQIGSPSLADLPPLMASHYVSGTGYASALYTGVSPGWWASYGGSPQVAILQFSSTAQVAGYSLDVSAFNGTRDDFARLLGSGSVPSSPPSLQMIGEDQMSSLSLPPCEKGPDGKLIPKRAKFGCCVGSKSQLVEAGWFNLSTGWADAERYTVWFIGENTDGGPSYLNYQQVDAPKQDHRYGWSLPDGTVHISVEYACAEPVGVEIERKFRKL